MWVACVLVSCTKDPPFDNTGGPPPPGTTVPFALIDSIGTCSDFELADPRFFDDVGTAAQQCVRPSFVTSVTEALSQLPADMRLVVAEIYVECASGIHLARVTRDGPTLWLWVLVADIDWCPEPRYQPDAPGPCKLTHGCIPEGTAFAWLVSVGGAAELSNVRIRQARYNPLLPDAPVIPQD